MSWGDEYIVFFHRLFNDQCTVKPRCVFPYILGTQKRRHTNKHTIVSSSKMSVPNEDDYASTMAIDKNNPNCKWCCKKPCLVLFYEKILNLLFECAASIDGLTLKEQKEFVLEEFMKVFYGDDGEESGVRILPVCITATVVKHFHGDDLISELMGL